MLCSRLLVLVCLVPIIACGDKASSPTRPSSVSPQPPPVIQVAGRWTGTSTTSPSDIIGGGCLGDVIREVGEPVTTNVTLTIRQTGTQLTGTSFTEATETDPANSCEFTGSISGTTIDLETNIDSCTFNVLSLPPVPGCGPDPWEIKETSSKATGTVSGSTIVGVVNATADFRNAGNVYEIRIAQQFEARR